MKQEAISNICDFKNERTYGIDLLRMVSMFMVLVLHILGHGGVLSALQIGTPEYSVVWFLEILAYCAVNCYALISGYVGINAKYKYSNIVLLWLQTIFNTLLITLIFSFFAKDLVTQNIFWSTAFPVSTATYWYLTAYTCMFFFIPLFNHVVNSLSKKQLTAIVFSIILIFSVISTFLKSDFAPVKVKDIFITSNGYSPLWLSLLYILGGYISKYRGEFKIKPILCFALYLLLCLLTLLEKLAVKNSVLVNYTSPTVLFCAIFLLIGFSQLKCKRTKRIIGFFAPLSFSVYIIHHHPIILNNYIVKKFSTCASYTIPLAVITIIGSAICIYLVCSAIDIIRHYLFKALRIKQRLISLEEKITKGLWQKVDH